MSFQQPNAALNARFCAWHDVAVLRYQRGEPVELPDDELLDWCARNSPDHQALIAQYCGEPLADSDALPVMVRQPAPVSNHFRDLDRWAAEKRRELG